MSATTADLDESGSAPSSRTDRRARPTLVIGWARREPHRVGQVLSWPLNAEEAVLGRGDEPAADVRAELFEQRPGEQSRAPALEMAAMSRRQLLLSRTREGVTVRNIGRCQLRQRGVATTQVTLRPGDVVELDRQLLLLCTLRPTTLPSPRALTIDPSHRFGTADRHGLVGESSACWALREQLAFLGRRKGHVLLLGESGVGKELCAQALHAHSERSAREIVSRNAATLPEGLVDAELFGNIANYPNPGMPLRPGLIGEADGSSLLLDEIGELPMSLQAHMLRLLDNGEYQRLGDAKSRRADVRVMAATNRALDELKHDLGARFKLRVHVPGLDRRREDVPLLAQHLLHRIAADDPEIGARFFRGWTGHTGVPRISIALMEALLCHNYTTHVRELERLLWTALTSSTGETIELTRWVREELASTDDAVPDKIEITRETLLAALDKHQGVLERVWRDLGLKNRHVLRRLLQKHGMVQKSELRNTRDE